MSSPGKPYADPVRVAALLAAFAPCIAARGLVAPSACAASSGAAPALRWIATEHVGRLTGTRTNPLAPLGLSGTDLGVSFAASGKLVFLFGDSWTTDRRDWDADSVAFAKLAPLPRTGVPALEWAMRDDGRFLPLAPKGITLGGMNVPVEGFAVGDRTYVFFDGGWDKQAGRHTHSLLAHTRKHSFSDLELDHSVASEKFLNVSVVQDGADLWIFGSGAYRKSAIYLARVPVRDVADRAAWRYFPAFGPDEASAQPLVPADCVGELSVRRDPRSSTYFMAYNCGDPRGVVLRSARAPLGSWSAPVVIFEPARDRGYGYFLHAANDATGTDDGLSERGREGTWGGEYGPYLVPSWFETPAPGVTALVYTLSTWNPYEVHLVRSWVTEAGTEWTPPARVPVANTSVRSLVNAGFEGGGIGGWTSTGDVFTTAQLDTGQWELTTYVKPAGDATTGVLAQEFTVPAKAERLECTLRGGTESIRLVRDGEVVRESRGPRRNDVWRKVSWRIDEFRGESVRFEIVDASKDPWGFVTVTGIAIVP